MGPTESVQKLGLPRRDSGQCRGLEMAHEEGGGKRGSSLLWAAKFGKREKRGTPNAVQINKITNMGTKKGKEKITQNWGKR